MAAWFPHGIGGGKVVPGGYAIVGECFQSRKRDYYLRSRVSPCTLFCLFCSVLLLKMRRYLKNCRLSFGVSFAVSSVRLFRSSMLSRDFQVLLPCLAA